MILLFYSVVCYNMLMENLTIFAFVGLEGSGTRTAIRHLSKQGMPKISCADGFHRARQQITNLANAGQRVVLLDDLDNWDDYVSLRHDFPAQSVIVGVFCPKHLRFHRLAKREYKSYSPYEANKKDWDDITEAGRAGIFALSDDMIIHDARTNMNEYLETVDQVVKKHL